jgi:hypothetical protein
MVHMAEAVTWAHMMQTAKMAQMLQMAQMAHMAHPAHPAHLAHIRKAGVRDGPKGPSQGLALPQYGWMAPEDGNKYAAQAVGEV